MLPRLHKLKEASEILGVPQKTLRGEIRAGRLKCYRPTPSPNAPILLRESDLLAWLENHAGQRQLVPSMVVAAEAKRLSGDALRDEAGELRGGKGGRKKLEIRK